MKDEELTYRLISQGIRPTAVRLLIGRFLKASDHPVSSLEIETALDTVDRSTITRALTLFLEKGIIHAIEDGSGSAKYEMCLTDDVMEDNDRHLHFHCRVCGRTVCLHSIPVIIPELPDGFSPESANFTITGICDRCAPKQ